MHYNICGEETLSLLGNNPALTAIIYAGDLLAVGGIKACNKLGLNVPEDVSIVGFNNSAYSDISTPTISSIDNLNHHVAEKCTRALYAMLNSENVEAIYKFMPKFIVKESTK